MNLVSSKPRVSKLEFFVALALVALAQSGKGALSIGNIRLSLILVDVSIEQVAALSSQNTLPEPTLDLDKLQTSTSTFVPSPFRQPSLRPGYSDDPWSAQRYSTLPPNPTVPGYTAGLPPPLTSTISNVAGTGLPDFWWKRQENVRVTILGQQGFILNRYVVYEIATEVSPNTAWIMTGCLYNVKRGDAVVRRYSEFTFLWDCLLRRYPFRLFPALPPKRIAADEQFLEQRRWCDLSEVTSLR